jgi:hypothetical protein
VNRETQSFLQYVVESNFSVPAAIWLMSIRCFRDMPYS